MSASRIAGSVPTRGISAPAPGRATGGGGGPPVQTRPPSSPAAAKAGAGKQATEGGLDVNNPKTKDELDAETDAAAKRSQTENQDALTGTKDRTDAQNAASGRQGDGTTGKQDKSPEAQKNRDDTDAAQEKGIKDKLKTPAGIALIVALGLTLALVATLLGLAGEELKKCKEASITVTKIEPSPPGNIANYIPFFSRVIKPKTVDITYTCNNSYQPIAGKESLTFSGTGFPEFDDLAIVVKKNVSANKFQIECGVDDCSDFKGTKGAAKPNCGDFADYFDKKIQDAAAGTGDFFGDLMSSFAGNWTTWLFVAAIVIGVVMLVSAFA